MRVQPVQAEVELRLLQRFQLFYLIWLPDLLWKGSTFEVHKFLTPWFSFNNKRISGKPSKQHQQTVPKYHGKSWKGEACLDRSRWHEFLAKGFSCHPCVWMRYEGGPVLPLLVARACELLPMLDWNLGQVSVVPVPYKVCLHTLMFFLMTASIQTSCLFLVEMKEPLLWFLLAILTPQKLKQWYLQPKNYNTNLFKSKNLIFEYKLTSTSGLQCSWQKSIEIFLLDTSWIWLRWVALPGNTHTVGPYQL